MILWRTKSLYQVSCPAGIIPQRLIYPVPFTWHVPSSSSPLFLLFFPSFSFIIQQPDEKRVYILLLARLDFLFLSGSMISAYRCRLTRLGVANESNPQLESFRQWNSGDSLSQEESSRTLYVSRSEQSRPGSDSHSLHHRSRSEDNTFSLSVLLFFHHRVLLTWASVSFIIYVQCTFISFSLH